MDASKYIVKYSKAAIDISDGLLTDLQHMLTASKKGAVLKLDDMPISDPMSKYMHTYVSYDQVLTGGEDYQLLFTIKPDQQEPMEKELDSLDIKVTHIGNVIDGDSIQILSSNNDYKAPTKQGFDHFD